MLPLPLDTEQPAKFMDTLPEDFHTPIKEGVVCDTRRHGLRSETLVSNMENPNPDVILRTRDIKLP
jgi:hypothetical protein